MATLGAGAGRGCNSVISAPLAGLGWADSLAAAGICSNNVAVSRGGAGLQMGPVPLHCQKLGTLSNRYLHQIQNYLHTPQRTISWFSRFESHFTLFHFNVNPISRTSNSIQVCAKCFIISAGLRRISFYSVMFTIGCCPLWFMLAVREIKLSTKVFAI